MKARRGYVVVEGHGEASGSVINLVTRLWAELALDPHVYWPRAMRAPGIHTDEVLKRECKSVDVRGDASLLLVLRDEDDACPRETAPRQAEIVRDLGLPFPVALVLAEREYESLFLASLRTLTGQALRAGAVERPGISDDAEFEGRAHEIRDAKGWLTSRMNQCQRRKVRYKPSMDQLPLTRLVDFAEVRRHGLPWFGTLERALCFLSGNLGRPGVYPAPS